MKYLGKITDPKDLVTKEYVDQHGGSIDTIPDISYDSTADTYTGGLRDELYLTSDTIATWKSILGIS